MLQYWSNLFAMLSVALVATAFFRDDWQAGFFLPGASSPLSARGSTAWLFRQKEGENESLFLYPHRRPQCRGGCVCRLPQGMDSLAFS